MTDKLDFTQPLALRRTPTVRVEGPLIGPDRYGRTYSVVDGLLMSWEMNGQVLGGHGSTCDLIPLQIAPVKWLTCWVDHYTDCASEASQAEMIERAVFDMLHEAMKQIVADQWSSWQKVAREVLAKVEAKL